MGQSFSKAANRQALLQRELGELGTVLQRRPRGEGAYRAAGWYAKLAEGKLVYLGDNTTVAIVTIAKLREKLLDEVEQGAFA